MDEMKHVELLVATLICCHMNSVLSAYVNDNNPTLMDFKSLQEAFINLQNHLNKVDMRLKSVEAENKKQSTEIAELKRSLAEAGALKDSHGETDELQEEDTPDKTNELQEKDTPGNQNLVQNVKDSSSGDMSKNRIRRADPLMDVAFFAKVQAEVHHLGTNQDIVFEEVVTNVGNAYNPRHGVFVAPVSGMYVLSTTILTYAHDMAHFAFALNGKPMTMMFANGPESGGDSDSQTIVLHLNKGDDVSVKLVIQVDTGLHGDGFSIFSGFLLPSVQYTSEEVG